MPRKPPVAVGQTYGTLTVVAQGKSDRRGGLRWMCACACGNPGVQVDDCDLRQAGGRRTCGQCTKWLKSSLPAAPETPKRRGRPARDFAAERAEIERFAPQAGDAFGSLVFVSHTRAAPNGEQRAVCRCSCGNPKVVVPTLKLVRHQIESCGCTSATAKRKALADGLTPWQREQERAELKKLERAAAFIRAARELAAKVHPGETHGCLTILGAGPVRERDGMPTFTASCNCGNAEAVVTAGTLLRRTHLSCGCTRVRKGSRS